jgi:photosystem II stability/assembly factor-like uncharacterized protein
MNGDDRLEQDVRQTLEGMAREPAPERLVARVAEIPNREPATRAGAVGGGSPARRFGSVFGLLAAGVAIVVVAIVARPAAIAPGVGASPSPAARSLPAATSSAPQGAAVPAGFEPRSATFVSSSRGWVLGGVPCAAGRCPAIVRTDDGGATWVATGAPPTKLTERGGLVGDGISILRFADASHGWAFGPELWTTHDGGASWARTTVPGLPKEASVAALEVAAGTAHAVAYDGQQDWRIATTAVGSDEWKLTGVHFLVGAGPVPEAQLVLAGPAGWILTNDRTVNAGARLTAGTWESWKPPCLDVQGPAVLAASSASEVAAVCDVGLMSNPTGEHLFVSHDGGRSFTEIGPRLPTNGLSAVAAPDPSTIVVAAGSELVVSEDGGRTWASSGRTGNLGVRELGFTTKTQGFVIAGDESGTGAMFMSRDAGRTWVRVGF